MEKIYEMELKVSSSPAILTQKCDDNLELTEGRTNAPRDSNRIII